MEETLEHVQGLSAAAKEIAARVQVTKNLDESALMDIFSDSKFLSTMGYGSFEEDARCSGHQSAGQAEVVLCSFTGSLIALIEFVRPGVDLAEKIPWFQERVGDVLGRMPSIAVLSNGTELWMFQVRDGYLQRPARVFNLAGLTNDEAYVLHTVFQHRQVEWERQLRYPPHSVEGEQPSSIPLASSHRHYRH